MSLTNAEKQNSNYTSSHCHERVALIWFFQALTLSSIDGVSNKNERDELRDQTHVLYIDILPSRMHLVVITTN